MLTQGTAHIEIVEILLNTYNADVNLLAGRLDSQQGMRSVHILEVALQHPRDICRSFLKMFLQHGASLFDRSKRTISKSVLHLAIVRNQDALDIFAEHDSNFIHAITKAVWTESMRCDTPLTGAIKSGFEGVALKLLSYGAPPHLTFDSSLDAEVGFGPPGKSAAEIAQKYFWQPILVAAENEMPKLLMGLLDRGADPHTTLTDEQARSMIEHRDCRNVLDIVRAKLMELRNWHKEDECINYDIKGTPEETKQLTGKENAVIRLIREYEEAEARLVTLSSQMTDGVNLEESPRPVSFRPQKKVQLGVPRSKEVPIQTSQTSDVDFQGLDFRKLKTLEDGHSAL